MANQDANVWRKVWKTTFCRSSVTPLLNPRSLTAREKVLLLLLDLRTLPSGAGNSKSLKSAFSGFMLKIKAFASSPKYAVLVPCYESVGRTFKSCRARHKNQALTRSLVGAVFILKLFIPLLSC